MCSCLRIVLTNDFFNSQTDLTGDQTCFMCGLPDHLIRDYPVASNPYPIFQTGKEITRYFLEEISRKNFKLPG